MGCPLPCVSGTLSDATLLKNSDINSQLAELLYLNVITDDFATLNNWTEVDSGANVNLAAGVVTLNGNGTWNANGIWYTAGIVRAKGYVELKFSLAASVSAAGWMGINNLAALVTAMAVTNYGAWLTTGPILQPHPGNTAITGVPPFTAATWYTLRIYVEQSDDASWKKVKISVQGGTEYPSETILVCNYYTNTAVASTFYPYIERSLNSAGNLLSIKEFRWYSGYSTAAPYKEWIHDAGAGKVFDSIDRTNFVMPGTVPSTNLTFDDSFDDGVEAYDTPVNFTTFKGQGKTTEQHRYYRIRVYANSDGATQVYVDKPNSDTATDGIGDWADIENVRDNDTNQLVTGGLPSDSILLSNTPTPGNYDDSGLVPSAVVYGTDFGVGGGESGALAYISGISPSGRLKTEGGETINIFGKGFTSATHLYFGVTEVSFTITDDNTLQIDSTPVKAAGVYVITLEGSAIDTITFSPGVEYDDKTHSDIEVVAEIVAYQAANNSMNGTVAADISTGKSVKVDGVTTNGANDKLYSAADEITRNEIPDLSKIPTEASGGPAAWLQRNVSRIGTWNLTTWEAARNTALKAFYKLGEIFKLLNVDTTGECEGNTETAPSAPTNCAAAAVSSTSNRITWDMVTALTKPVLGYEVHRSATQGGVYTLVSGASLIQDLEFTDSTVLAGSTWWYKVRAKNDFGYGAFSDADSATTPAAAVAPTAIEPPFDFYLTSNSGDGSPVYTLQHSQVQGQLDVINIFVSDGMEGGQYIKKWLFIPNKILTGIAEGQRVMMGTTELKIDAFEDLDEHQEITLRKVNP